MSISSVLMTMKKMLKPKESRPNVSLPTTRRRKKKNPRRVKSLPSPTSSWISSHGMMKLTWKNSKPPSDQLLWMVSSGVLVNSLKLGKFIVRPWRPPSVGATFRGCHCPWRQILNNYLVMVSRSFKSPVSLKTTRLWWTILKIKSLVLKTLFNQWTSLLSTKSKLQIHSTCLYITQ